jgi:ribosomal 50S subunit-associated protein YjgA (DUF615 family)
LFGIHEWRIAMMLKEVDRIVSEVSRLDERERNLFVKKIERLYAKQNIIKEGDDLIQSVFGLWKDYDIDKETLRCKAWK